MDFQLRKNKVVYLSALLIVIILVTLAVFWKGFLSKPGPPEQAKIEAEKVEIDFDILKSDALKKLHLFEKVPSFKKETGRKNPFTPYREKPKK